MFRLPNELRRARPINLRLGHLHPEKRNCICVVVAAVGEFDNRGQQFTKKRLLKLVEKYREINEATYHNGRLTMTIAIPDDSIHPDDVEWT